MASTCRISMIIMCISLTVLQDECKGLTSKQLSLKNKTNSTIWESKQSPSGIQNLAINSGGFKNNGSSDLTKINGAFRSADEGNFYESSMEKQTATGQSAVVEDPSPCSIQLCGNNTIVNCAGLSLMSITPSWFPRNTSAIILDRNAIETIHNSSFAHLSNLAVLSLADNKIKHIESGAFRTLNNLESLNLEYNRLNEKSILPGLFDNLLHLKKLRLCNNKLKRNLPTSLLKQIKQLTFLTVDVTGDTLLFGQELKHLTDLVVSGDVTTIDNESFKNVGQIRNLVVHDLPSMSNFSDSALQALPNLTFYEMSRVLFGVKKSLQTLKPLSGKNMTRIRFSLVSFSRHEHYSALYNHEGILDSDKTKYLTKICVKHFSLTSSSIFVIDADALSGDVWNRCLKSLDVSGNKLTGSKAAIFKIFYLRHIEMMSVEHLLRSCYRKRSFQQISSQQVSVAGEQLPTCDQISASLFNDTDLEVQINEQENVDTRQYRSPRSHIEDIYLSNNETHVTKDFSLEGIKQFHCPYADISAQGYFFTVYISPSLKYVKAKSSFAHSGVNKNIRVVGASNLIYLDLSDNGLDDFSGRITGLESLRTMILSGNDVSVISETFFDGMCRLQELDLSNCQLDSAFMSNQSARVFQNLPDLTRLDISLNHLYSLSPKTFHSNRMLENLDLSKNRFRIIPFDLKTTPRLMSLDLRENFITSLLPHETHELDKLATKPGGFTLLLSGNILTCGCDSFRLLHWLENTLVLLDDGGNFTCMNSEGELSYTGGNSDLEVLWRKCWGEFFLSLSLILLLSMTTGFFSVFFVWKNKTFITSKILQMLTGYKLKGLADYRTGVYIGYADKDYRFPCFVLRPFIEDRIHMSTYVPHRDLEPSLAMASSIANAINDSWRILLVFSENFFNDEWSLFTIRTAIYAQSPVNPESVVVLVQENLRHRLPAEVLSSVPEDNIVVVPEWEMSYELREKLRTRLM